MIYLYDGTETDFTYNGQPLPKARSTVVDYLINDEFYVTFQYPLDEDNVYKQIEKDKIITAHTPEGMQPFRIIDPAKHANYIEVEAWPLFYADMRNKLVRPLTLRNATGHTVIAQFLNNLLLDTPFEITTNISDTHDYHTQDETERENNPNQLYDALEVFKAIVNRWNGEVIINGYDIRVVSRVGSNKEALLYEEKNIAEFVDEESLGGLVTRLHGKSQWTEDDNDGEQIERSIQTTVDSPLINAYSGIIFEKQYTNNDIRTERELKNWLNLMFTTDNMDKPKRNIEVGTNVVDGQEIHAGDGLVLKYMKHDVDMEIRMIGYQYDGFANRYINIYLGDAKEKVTGSFKNSISNVENNINNNMQQISHTIVNSMGQKLIYSETEPKGNFKEGDTWFDNEGGMFFWDEEKADWIPHPYNRRTDIAEQLIKEAQQDLEETKENIDNRLTDLNNDIADKFTDLDVEIATIETISNRANDNAQIAIDDAYTAYNTARTSIDIGNEAQLTAQSALDNIDGLETYVDVEIDNINGELSRKVSQTDFNSLNGTVSEISTVAYQNQTDIGLKANSSLVDTINQTVENHSLAINANAETLELKADNEVVDTLNNRVSTAETNININAEGLAVKADSSRVDTLEGAVSSLGAEFDVVAGKVSSKVWMEDIDDIEVGGRNYAFNTNDNFHPLRISGYSGTINQGLIITTEYKYSMDDLSAKIGDKITVSLYIRDTEYDLGGYLRIDIPGRPHKYSNRTIVKDGYISSTFTIDEETFNAGAILIYVGSSQHGTTYFVDVKEFQIEKGNKATDWSPAPEDTDAKIDYVESEMIQKYDSITSTVSSIDGRVSSQEQRVDSITTTIQEVQSDIDGNTTLINQTVSTVNTHTQTIATIETDLEGKATVAQYNTLVSTVEGSIQRIGNAEGDITQIEASVNGLQTTVSDPVNGLVTQVSTLASGFNVLAKDFGNTRNYFSVKYWYSIDDKPTTTSVPYVDLELEPNTQYTVSTNFPVRNSNLRDVFAMNTNQSASSAQTGVAINEPRTVTTLSDGILRVAVREHELDTGKYWVQAEKGNEATEFKPNSEDMATQAQLSVLNDNINLRVTSNQLDTAISDSLSTAEAYADSTAQTAQEAAQEYAELKAEAERELAEVYAGGLISAEQQERITAIENNLSEAQSYAETKASEAKTASDAYTDIVAKDKVDIGKVVSQINIETDNILIESGKLYLDAESTVFGGDAFIPSAAIESLTADKINTGELNGANVRIVNLDFNTAVGNRTEFVQSAWNNAVGGNVRINGSGILTTASDSSQTYIQNGIVGTRNPSGSTIGQIGYIDEGGSPNYTIQGSWGSHFQIRMSRGPGNLNKRALRITAGGLATTINTDDIYLNASNRTTVQSDMTVQGNLNLGTNHINARRYGFSHGSWIYDDSRNSALHIVGGGGLRLYTHGAGSGSSNEAIRFDRSYTYMYRNLSMEGYKITNQSDERLKSNIENTQLNSLEAIKTWQFVDYDWIEGEHGQFGLIAQYTSEISIYEEGRDVWSIDSSKQLMMTTHAVQQLSLAHDNTNLVASEALILGEDNKTDLTLFKEETKSEINLLKEELLEANKRIEELESAA